MTSLEPFMRSCRKRLDKWFTAHASEKYGGREEETPRDFVRKCGPEPSALPRSDSLVDSGQRGGRVGCSEKHAADKLSGVDAAPATFVDCGGVEVHSNGRSAASTSSSVVSPYNVHDARWRLARMFMEYAPEKLAMVNQMMERHAGHEREMLANYVECYGPEPPAPDTQTPRSRLTRFIDHYVPHKAAVVEEMLKRHEGQTDILFAKLAHKFGPEPPAPFSRAAIPDLTYRQRLIRFYKVYAREKVAEVDVVLQRYKGNEETMFHILVEKYGPEPSFDAPTLAHETTTTAGAQISLPGDSGGVTLGEPEIFVASKNEEPTAAEAKEWLQHLSLPLSMYRRYAADRLGEDCVSGAEDHFAIPRWMNLDSDGKRWVVARNPITLAKNSGDASGPQQMQEPETAEHVSANFACFLLILETVKFPLPENYTEADVFRHYPLCTLLGDRERFSLQTSASFMKLRERLDDVVRLLFCEEEVERQRIEQQMTKWKEKYTFSEKEKESYVRCVLEKAVKLLPEFEKKERREIEILESIELKGKFVLFRHFLCEAREKRFEGGNGLTSTPPSFLLSRRGPRHLTFSHSIYDRKRMKPPMTCSSISGDFAGKDRRLLFHNNSRRKEGRRGAFTAATAVNTANGYTSFEYKATPLRGAASWNFASDASPAPRNPHIVATSPANVCLRVAKHGKTKIKRMGLTEKKTTIAGRDKWGSVRRGQLSEVAPSPCLNAYEAVSLSEKS